MTANHVQCIGIRRIKDKDRITAYFAYEDKENVDGIAVLTFTFFGNSRSYNMADIAKGSYYDITYHRNDKYFNVDGIRKLSS